VQLWRNGIQKRQGIHHAPNKNGLAGMVGYVGVPHGVAQGGIDILGLFFSNRTLRGGPAPVRAYMEELMADVLDGKLDPSPIFDRAVDLDGVPAGYAAMDQRESLKVLIRI